MTTNDNVPIEGIREQLETLARWMGWKRVPWYPSNHSMNAWMPAGGHSVAALYFVGCVQDGGWSPFTDANADYQVLERAREVWMGIEEWDSFRLCIRSAGYYRVGDYARAVLAVLGQEEQA